MTLKKPVRLSDSIGALEKISESSSKDLSFFNFETFRSMGKGEYAMTLDLGAYKEAILEAATDYNTVLADELKDVSPKK